MERLLNRYKKGETQMRLTIGSTTIEITDCVRMRDTKRGFYLDITIPKENIGMEELYTLLDGCTEKIIVTDENGAVAEYMGFKSLGSFACEDGLYKVAQICTSEYEAQLSLAQSKIAEQDSVIEMQMANIMALEEQNVMQLSTIESLMLEVIPTVITETVTVAVAEALASNSPEAE
jgi:hypothetical protein